MSRYARHDSAALARTRGGCLAALARIRGGCLAALARTVQCSSFHGLTAPLSFRAQRASYQSSTTMHPPVISSAASKLPIQHYDAPSCHFERSEKSCHSARSTHQTRLTMSRCARQDSAVLVVPRPNSPLVISSAASKLPIQHYDAPPCHFERSEQATNPALRCPLLSFRAQREILPFGALHSPDQANDVSLRSPGQCSARRSTA